MASKSKSSLGDVAQSMLEKRLLPSGTKGTYLLPGTDTTVRGKDAAIKALVSAAGDKDATATTRNALAQAEAAQKVHDLAEQGRTQLEIAAEVNMDITHVGDLLRWAAAEPIIWQDEDELQRKVVTERDKSKTSWAGIAIRAGVTKGVIQRLYKNAGKDPHKSDIGKGGRRKETYSSGPKAETKTKKTVTKKAPAKSSAKPAGKKAPAKSAGKRTVKKPVGKGTVKTEDTPF